MSHRTGATVDTPAACARRAAPDGLSKLARYSFCNHSTEGGVRSLLSHCRSGKARPFCQSMPEAPCPLHLLSPHFHTSIVFKHDMRILTEATISTFLASPMTYFMMDAAIGHGLEHNLNGRPTLHCPQPCPCQVFSCLCK